MAMIMKLLLWLVIAFSMVIAFPLVTSIRALPQQQQQTCPDGSQPDSSGNCPSTQQLQPTTPSQQPTTTPTQPTNVTQPINSTRNATTPTGPVLTPLGNKTIPAPPATNKTLPVFPGAPVTPPTLPNKTLPVFPGAPVTPPTLPNKTLPVFPSAPVTPPTPPSQPTGNTTTPPIAPPPAPPTPPPKPITNITVPVSPTPTGGTIVAPVLGVNIGVANNLLQLINIFQQNINIGPTIINNQVVNNINNINTITTVNNQVIQNTVIKNPQGVVVKPTPQVIVVNKLTPTTQVVIPPKFCKITDVDEIHGNLVIICVKKIDHDDKDAHHVHHHHFIVIVTKEIVHEHPAAQLIQIFLDTHGKGKFANLDFYPAADHFVHLKGTFTNTFTLLHSKIITLQFGPKNTPDKFGIKHSVAVVGIIKKGQTFRFDLNTGYKVKIAQDAFPHLKGLLSAT
jgi:hypothetical protein